MKRSCAGGDVLSVQDRVIAEIRAACDFLEREPRDEGGKVEPRGRIPLASWWARIVAEAPRSGLQLARREEWLEKSKAYFEEQLAASLEMCCQSLEKRGLTVDLWLAKLRARGRERWTDRHQNKLDAYLKHKTPVTTGPPVPF